MILRAKHGAPALSSNLFKIIRSSLNASSFSLYSKPYLTTPKPTPRRPTSLAARTPSQISETVSSSDVSLICSLLSTQTHESAINLDNLLEGFKEKLNSNLVLEILMNYKQLGRIKTLEFFSWAGLQMGFQFDDCVVEYVADFLGRRKLFDDMKCLLATVFSYKGRVSCRVFSICIRFLGRQGRVRDALCLFEEMESKFRCKPDNFVYNNMLYVLCKKERSEELIDFALMIFRKIKAPDTYSYSNILVGLCKFGRFETAFEVFGEMHRAGLVPTRSAVNTLVGQLCLLSAKEGAVQKVRVKDAYRPFTILVPNMGANSGAIQPAVGVFLAVHEMGLLPSAFVINQLISELCRLGKTQEAVNVLKVVEDRKLSCVEEGYSAVIQALCEYRLVEEASYLFGRMLSRGMKPKLVIYNSVISMLCKLGSLDDAKRVFEIMNKKRCLPDNLTYSALIHAYADAMNWETAYGSLIEMLGLGLSPHFHTYSLVEKLLREHGQLDLCFKLEQKLDSQILQKLCKAGELEAACEKLKSMVEKGFYPSGYVREAFEHALRKCGKLNIARELLEKIDGRMVDCKPDEIKISS
ncbi:pentatricopeptide repeat-containing protein At3g06920-like [Corylus avellana]|uniref:pentatricopeptide repeat-containing protein At3g06920-like n=1 Tax=Corylus avellana TaxID=13451 RepID=UPI001E22BC4C|nr:pentatricopeptide repeat-containing protein At3g06920-like [Corylus avellana]XP_059456760.1 pentatricopeptide repeat-containing protein At3g06920-like [Corylus avellana]XP_059456768.1 pentatricopeptide repeat-containing protein At3g06920-like [Corylus avellana]XP_059456776.1 pentatricopeptide repeat-containing protein At3g06920-like [Corylus avellana]